MNDLFLAVLKLAQDLDVKYEGMASVSIVYHPYECHWIAKVDWSNSYKIEAVGDVPEEALNRLHESLVADLIVRHKDPVYNIHT